ncbi:hypothetical protein HPB50_022006 [Hyalomma asiaticum]|uniref:Uncharacterized protein n=1 Tax=Hyalomma asiaticum TaxID=266040 RepID=A0ACB7SXD3_HYAAI|nr:hypothetical protein HPB50_022006 [Hyalomma asiaticum]
MRHVPIASTGLPRYVAAAAAISGRTVVRASSGWAATQTLLQEQLAAIHEAGTYKTERVLTSRQAASVHCGRLGQACAQPLCQQLPWTLGLAGDVATIAIDGTLSSGGLALAAGPSSFFIAPLAFVATTHRLLAGSLSVAAFLAALPPSVAPFSTFAVAAASAFSPAGVPH